MELYLNYRQLEESLDLINEGAQSSGRKTGFFIGNTRKFLGESFQLTPIRQSTTLVAGSALVSSAEQAEDLARKLDGRVDFLFVDAEKKIPESAWGSGDAGNIEVSVRRICKKSQLITYKANDLAVQAMDKLIAELANSLEKGIGGANISILGLGNIGSKLALSLVERGANVQCFRRDQETLKKIVAGLNEIKPPETLAKITAFSSALAAAAQADILIGLTPGIPVITPEIVSVMSKNGVLIDGGRGSISEKAIKWASSSGVKAFRADVQTIISGEIDNLLRVHKLVTSGFTRSQLGHIRLVSSGLLASRGEVVVDDAQNPRHVFGVADGRGDLLTGMLDHESDYIKLVKDSLRDKAED
jgi:hypothetical protein